MNELWLIPVILVLVCCSAFFSGSEIIFASCNHMRLKHAAEQGSIRARIALSICDQYSRTLPTILVGNVLVNIATSSAATLLCIAYFGSKGQTIATIGTTLLLLTCGEILPKVIGKAFADQLIVYVAPLMRFWMIVFSPVVLTVSALIRKLEPIWTPKQEDEEETEVSDELVTILETIEEEGVIDEKEGELIRSAIEFTDLTAQDILIPRVDVFAWDMDDDIQELLNNEDMLSFSRLPVYKDSLDNVVGILSVKRLMRAVAQGQQVRLEELMYEPMYVHKTRTIASILAEFRRKYVHLAVVLDEYGGTMGILTMEDILEEIVGDIYDEHDDVEEEIVEIRKDIFEVDGSTTLHDFFDSVEYDDRDFESEYTTMGGWAMELLDKLPEVGDHFAFENMRFMVKAMAGHRVETLSVQVLPREEEETHS